MAATFLTDLAHVVTVDADNTVLQDASILVEDGVLTAIGARADLQARANSAAATRVAGDGRLAMPGLVNLHTHLPMALLRGIAEDVDLQGFLTTVWAAEAAVMDEPTVELGARLGALEALRGGTTTANDMYFHPVEAHRGAVAAGLRHVIGPVFFEGPSPDGLAWDERMTALQEWPARLAEIGGPQVPYAVCPHSTYTSSPRHLREVVEAVADWGQPVLHTHVSENAAENADVRARHASTPTGILASVGALDGHLRVVAGHGVHLDEGDLALLAAADAAVAHCPGSNLKLASGLLDWRRVSGAGVRLGLGTDGCSSSNDLDLWQTMRQAALLARLSAGRPDAVTAAEVLRAATVEGARALGMGDLVGSLEVGKRADIVLLDLDAPHLTPVHDVPALLVYAAGRGDVTDVFVDGERVVADRLSTRLEQSPLLTDVRRRAASANACVMVRTARSGR